MSGVGTSWKITAKSTILALVVSTVGFVVPANAVEDTDITLGGSGCQLSGTGSPTDPYLVASAKQLAEINDCNDGSTYRYYRQTANIDLTPTSDASQAQWNDTTTGGWVPIGDYGSKSTLFADLDFHGDFNGAGFVISNLEITSSTRANDEDYFGLFGRLDRSYIHNLSLSNVEIDAGYEYIGAIAGRADYSNLDQISLTSGMIKVYSRYAGGLIGRATNSNLSHISAVATIQKTNDNRNVQYLGGIVGDQDSTNISHASFTGDVLGDSTAGTYYGTQVGGISGQVYGATTDVTVIANITGSEDTGGVFGQMGDGVASDISFNGTVSASAGDITRRAYRIGGIAGFLNYGTIVNAVGIVSVTSNGALAESLGEEIGGAVGRADNSSLLNYVEIKGAVTATNAKWVGGFAGRATDAVAIRSASYQGNVSSTIGSGVGGLIGIGIDGIQVLRSAVESGSSVVSDNTEVGGLLGRAQDGVSIIDSYNRAIVSGSDKVAGIVGATEETTAVGSLAIKNTYTTGSVTATAASPVFDAFAPGSSYRASDNSNAYDATTTAQATSGSGVTGYTTAQMKDRATFDAIGWKLDTVGSPWTIDPAVNDGYPNLNGPAVPVPVVAANVELAKIKFTAGSTKLSKSAKKLLRAAAASVKAGGYTKVTVRVYTTSNKSSLSLKRAQVIASYLKKQGVTVVISKQAALTKSKKLNNKARIYGNIR